jgi:hypothetical protein
VIGNMIRYADQTLMDNAHMEKTVFTFDVDHPALRRNAVITE